MTSVLRGALCALGLTLALEVPFVALCYPGQRLRLAGVGYDGDRLFLENSGADLELSRPGATAEYWYAPVGNDVDLWSDHDPKWEKPTKGVAGAIADAFTSVAARTFIPVYPKDGRFRGTAVT
jgi:hypothetical protein